MQTWTEEHFEKLSWHDNHVYGLRLIAGDHGSGQLVLDIDYILEWRKASADKFHFLIAPAVLTFNGVSDLKVALDYKVASAALVPFSIQTILRTLESRERYTAKLWCIEINWPEGQISFEATGFEQRLTGEAVLSDHMWLKDYKRGS